MLDLVLAQSELYPKVWIFTLCNPGSIGSQYCGQKNWRSASFRHVLIEPPRRPCTNIKSIRGSGEECSSRKPSGPRAPSSSCWSRRFLAQVLVNHFLLNGFGGDSASILVSPKSAITAAEELGIIGEALLRGIKVSLPRVWISLALCVWETGCEDC